MAIRERQTVHRHRPRQDREGSVLVVVLVTVMLLTLASYSFTELMVSEFKATTGFTRRAEARAFAESGIELSAALLGDRSEETVPVDLHHNPSMLSGVLMRDAESDTARGRFSIVAPEELDPAGSTLRFGLIDESSRLNLNALLDQQQQGDQGADGLGVGLSVSDSSSGASASAAGLSVQTESDGAGPRDRLMQLPEMTVDIADAILDWLDDDEQPRQFGAENEYYGTLDPPYSARNGRLESLGELLHVRGITPWLLYGEDTNRNGLLDANENDGGATAPWDDGDGTLWRGWSAYFTVHSLEAIRRSDGTPRIDVNQDDLASLYDQLATELDEDAAQFITAWRLSGPVSDDGASSRTGGGSGDRSGNQGGNGRGSGGGSRSGAAGGGGGSGGNGSGGRGGGASGSVERRGGLELSGGGENDINSLFELIDAEVDAEVNGQQQTLVSPWTSGSDLETAWPQVADVLTTHSEDVIEGRINIQQASRDVLLTVPEMDESLVESILAAQAATAGTDPALDATGTRSSTAWLLMEGLVDVDQMAALDRYITTGGDVFRVQSVGFYDGGGPTVRLEAIIDATRIAPRIVMIRDLTELGRGFESHELINATSGSRP